MTNSTPRGVVLGSVVLLLLALTLVAHGALVVARGYRQGGEEVWEAIRVRRAVVGRVQAAAVRGDTSALNWAPTGPGVVVRVQPISLSPELTLWRGEGRSGVARWWAGELVWRADPVERGRAASAVAEVGGRVAPSTASIHPSSGGSCASDRPQSSVGRLGAAGLHLGPLDVEGLASRLSPWRPPGATPPANCASGGCPPSAGLADGPLTLSGGSYRGVFLVRGHLTLTDSAVVHGTLFVEGDLMLRTGARVSGAVQVLGDLVMDPDANLHGDPCGVTAQWFSGLDDRLGPVVLDARPWALWQRLP